MTVSKNEELGTTTLTLHDFELKRVSEGLWDSICKYHRLLYDKKYVDEEQKLRYIDALKSLNNIREALGEHRFPTFNYNR